MVQNSFHQLINLANRLDLLSLQIGVTFIYNKSHLVFNVQLGQTRVSCLSRRNTFPYFWFCSTIRCVFFTRFSLSTNYLRTSSPAHIFPVWFSTHEKSFTATEHKTHCTAAAAVRYLPSFSTSMFFPPLAQARPGPQDVSLSLTSMRQSLTIPPPPGSPVLN